MAQEAKKPEIDPKAHRRILRFLNDARTPGDLLELPENEIRMFVEGMRKRPDLHEPVEKKPRVKLFEREQAERVFKERQGLSPLYGFTHIEQLEKILGRDFFRKFLDLVVRWFSGATYGEWSPAGSVQVDGETIVARHAAVLRTGLVLLIEGACGCKEDGVMSRTPLWDPKPRTMKIPSPAPPGDNLYCSGHCFLSDGKLLAMGGAGESNCANKNIAWIFDPATETWDYTRNKTTGARTYLHYERWYPTAVMLGDEPGRVLIASGDLAHLGCGTSTSPPAMPMEIYSEGTGEFTVVTTGANKYFRPTYPGLHLLPGGEIFFAPVGFKNNSESAGPCAGNEESAYFEFTSLTTGVWTPLGGPNDRTKGMSVLLLSPTYPFVQVMVVGGGDSTASREYALINLSTFSPTWLDHALERTPGQTEPTPRIHPNVVLLPDGTVFVCGGADVSEPCWLYNPASLSWSRMDELNNERRYHSVAVLLPTGEVMATGGQWNPAGDATIEVFRPPYLFKGAPPVIDAVSPSPVHHGNTFTIETAQASEICKVVLVRPMAVTHQTDSEQRVIQLPFCQSGSNRLSATAPNGWHPHGTAPRGWYMLFILNGAGVPSEAKFIHLH